MTTFAVVPVKTLLKSKTRLSHLFNVQERRLLTLAMLEDVLNALKSSELETVVVGSDTEVEGFVKNFGITFLKEKGQGLNPALNQAVRWCVRNHSEAVLALPADVPLITTRDLNTLMKMTLNDCAVIAPSKNGGTNALLVSPPEAIPPSFGVNSFKRHLAKARTKNIHLKIYISANIMLDIDSEGDLEQLLKAQRQTASYRFLLQSSWGRGRGVA